MYRRSILHTQIFCEKQSWDIDRKMRIRDLTEYNVSSAFINISGV